MIVNSEIQVTTELMSKAVKGLEPLQQNNSKLFCALVSQLLLLEQIKLADLNL